MVVAASSHNGTVIDAQDIKIANTFLEGIEGSLVDTFSHVSYSQSATGKHAEKFIQLLKKEGGTIDHSKALNRLYNYVDKDGLKTIVDTLEDSKIISVTITGRKRTYKLLKEK